MEPSALLVTVNRYRGVASRLGDINADDFPGVHIRVKSVHSFEDIPPLLRSRKDLVALDGYGWTDGPDAYFGTGKVFTQFCPDYLRGEEDRGVVAPIVVLAFCRGGEDPFHDVIERCINRDHVAFLGSTRTVAYDDADRIYPSLLRLLAELGSNPDPVAAHARLESIAPDIGAAWRPALLRRRGSCYPQAHGRTAGHQRVA
jgi:hypothetical protein